MKGSTLSWSKCLLFIPGALSFSLGTWQLFRRQDKIELLEYRKKRLEMNPLMLCDMMHSHLNFEDLEFRKLYGRGILDEKKSIFLGPRSRSISGVTHNGYYIITPLLLIPNDQESVQSAILVNRGWVPRSLRDELLKHSSSIDERTASIKQQQLTTETQQAPRWNYWSKKQEGFEDKSSSIHPVEITGVIRGGENPSLFVPENEPGSGQWFYINVPEMCRACGLPENTLYVEAINDNVDRGSPYPLPKDADSFIRSPVMPRDHLNYTFTWYSLSAAVTYMAFLRLKPGRMHKRKVILRY